MRKPRLPPRGKNLSRLHIDDVVPAASAGKATPFVAEARRVVFLYRAHEYVTLTANFCWRMFALTACVSAVLAWINVVAFRKRVNA